MTKKIKNIVRFECDSTNFHRVEGVSLFLFSLHLSPVLSNRLVVYTCAHKLALDGPSGGAEVP
jgi:hypothetical protein